MFTDLLLSKKNYVFYYAPEHEYHFTLEYYQNNKTLIQFFITWHKNKLFSVVENINNKHTYFDHLKSDHSLIQSFKETTGFKEAMTFIHTYETDRKNQIRITNPCVEGKLDNGKYILSFQLLSPLLIEERINFSPSFDERLCTEIPSLTRFFYVAVIRKGNSFFLCSDIKYRVPLSSHRGYLPAFYNWSSLHKMSYTHPSFVEDITEVLLKDPRIRVKLLVT